MSNLKKILSAVLVICLLATCMAACTPSIQAPTNPPTQKPTSGNNNSTNPTDPAGNTDPTDPTVPTVPVQEDLLKFEAGTILRMATGYNNAKTGLFFDASVAGEGITLADGKTYHTGELKPTWVEVENRLGMKFENKYTGKSATEEFKYWQEQLNQVDMVSGNATALNEWGVNGSLVNIADYLDLMPNFKA